MKDVRYQGIKSLLETNKISRFEDIFLHIAKRPVYEELHMGFATFNERVAAPGKFSIDELRRLAELIDIDPRILIELILADKKKKK